MFIRREGRRAASNSAEVWLGQYVRLGHGGRRAPIVIWRQRCEWRGALRFLSRLRRPKRDDPAPSTFIGSGRKLRSLELVNVRRPLTHPPLELGAGGSEKPAERRRALAAADYETGLIYGDWTNAAADGLTSAAGVPRRITKGSGRGTAQVRAGRRFRCQCRVRHHSHPR